jgi:hypothetical protein
MLVGATWQSSTWKEPKTAVNQGKLSGFEAQYCEVLNEMMMSPQF